MTNRQNEIIEKSIEIIAEKGIQGLTIKNLSKAINVSEPAIYRHFSSKTEILSTMLDNLDNITTGFTNEILAKKLSALKKLEKILTSYFNVFSSHPYWVSVVFADEIFKNDNMLMQKIKTFLEKKENVFVELISDAQKEKSVRKDVNKKHIAMMIIGSLRLLVKKWEISGFSFDMQKEGKKLIKTILVLISQK